MNLLQKIRNSLSFRSGALYRNFFQCIPLLPTRKFSDENSAFRYLTLVGREQLAMLRASLWSLQEVSHQLPPLTIACDTSLDCLTLSRAMKWWPGPIQIWTAEDLSHFSDECLPGQIAYFCKNHLFGLKFAAVIRAGMTGCTIYADTDVLWFRSPELLLPRSRLGCAASLQLQCDRQMCYDPRLVELWPTLEQQPYCCAGVIVLRGDLRDLYSEIETERLIEIFGSPNYFTEQSIFAVMQKKIGMGCLDAEAAYLSWNDQFKLGPTFFNQSWILRHYVGPVRHIFWRDVVYLLACRAWRRAA